MYEQTVEVPLLGDTESLHCVVHERRIRGLGMMTEAWSASTDGRWYRRCIGMVTLIVGDVLSSLMG